MFWNGCCPLNKHPYDEENNEINEINEMPSPIKNTDVSSSSQIIDEVQIIDEIFDLKKDTSGDDKESIISASVNGGHAAKKALMKLSLDKLKAKCEERELSTEGTKNQLADRIIVYDNTTTTEAT